MDPAEMSTVELKAAGFDLLVQRQQIEVSLQAVTAELSRRAQAPDVPDDIAELTEKPT